MNEYALFYMRRVGGLFIHLFVDCAVSTGMVLELFKVSNYCELESLDFKQALRCFE
jgi:hypothetical protein